jgi:RNA recognition motif-containing protein
MIDSHTDKSREFGFVEMANAEDRERAIAALNGALLGDRALKVDDARPRSDIPRFRGSRRR